MPETSRYSQPSAGELPGTLKRSPREAQQTFTQALTNAVQKYGESDQAQRAAYAELKQAFENAATTGSPRTTSPADHDIYGCDPAHPMRAIQSGPDECADRPTSTFRLTGPCWLISGV